MSVFVVLERSLLMKPYWESYLKILFKNFVERFDILDNNCIWWLSLTSSLTNGFGFLVNNKDGFNTMILKFRLQKFLQQVLLIFSHSSISTNTCQAITPSYIPLK